MRSRKPASEALFLSLGDLERLRSSPARLWRLHGPIELRIPELAQRERDLIESRLNELAGVCGCAEGSIAGAIALIAIVVFWIQREIAFSFQSVLTAGLTVIGAALLVKLVRVVAARVQLRGVLGDLLGTSPAATKPPQRGAMP